MAKDIVAVPVADGAEGAPHEAVASAYTPEDHQKASGLKVTRLVELGTNVHGKTATFEFEGGFVRDIDIDAETVWHPIFDGLERKDWHRIMCHVERRERLADGSFLVQDGPMWFWTRRTTPRGRDLEVNRFDVPAETYSAGRLTGARAARDLILFLRKYEITSRRFSTADLSVEGCFEQAFALQCGRRFGTDPSPANAARTFCQLVASYFIVGACGANPAYLDAQVSDAERSLAWELDYKQRQRNEFVNRMKAARTHKAATAQPAEVEHA